LGKFRLDLFAAVVIWGWTFPASRICLQYLTPADVLTVRLVLAVPILGAMVAFRGRRRRPTRHDLPALLGGAAILAVHFIVQLTGLNYTSATNTGWIIAAIPLVMAVLSYLILRERLGRRAKIGIAIATGGIILLVSKGNLGDLAWLNSTGDWLILVSCHTWALYTITTRDLARRRDPLTITFLMMIPALVAMLTWSGVTWDRTRWTGLPLDVLLALLFLGVLGTGAAHYFWQRGVAETGASRAGIYLYLEPIAATMVAVPLLKEPFGLFTALGGGLVLAGVWWASGSGRN
jgi:drug/metabolite transporter (DMT)-like permease